MHDDPLPGNGPDKSTDRNSPENAPDGVAPAHHGEAPAGDDAQISPDLLNHDITPILQGWDYEPGTINVRKVSGLDGSPKLQMRLDLGLLQMEMTGRPDGVRPFGCESLLEYHELQLKDHLQRTGSNIGFHLTGEECQSLREEAVMYYHRYLSLFVLGEFNDVIRDTERNLRVLDICGQYAVSEHDRLILEQYRPYLIMMNARARASIFFRDEKYNRALHAVKRGLKRIREFFARFEQEDAYAQCNEVKVLKRFARDIRRKLPHDPVRTLQVQLNRAIKAERYEEAARLRDQIQAHRAGPAPQGGM